MFNPKGTTNIPLLTIVIMVPLNKENKEKKKYNEECDIDVLLDDNGDYTSSNSNIYGQRCPRIGEIHLLLG